MSRDTKFVTELDNTDVLRRMQMVRANPNPGGPEGSGPFIYAIYVFDLQEGRPIRQFGFDIPPKSIRENEDYASEFAAAQEGGFWTDERGVYFKNLEIAGDFGFRPTPKRGRNSFSPLTNRIRRSANQLNEASGRLTNSIQAGMATFPDGEITGNDRFRMLRNIFSFYADRKKYRETSSRTAMVWANFRKGEAYLCQPMRFGEDRSAPSGRHKSAYTFSLRAFAPLRVEVPKDFLMSPRSASGRTGWLDKLKQVSNVIDSSRRLIESTVDGSVDFGFDVVEQILRPASEVVELARTIIDGAATVARFPLEVMRSAHRSCVEAVAILGQAGPKFERIAAEYSRMSRALANAFLPAKIFSRQNVNAPAQKYASKYKERTGTPPFETDPESTRMTADTDTSGFVLGSSGIPRGERKVKIPRNLSIRGIAQQFLGKAGRWKEIAVLNGLRSPWVDPRGDGVTVLQPGQLIRIPAEESQTEGQIFDTRDASAATQENEGYDFGRDLKIDLNTRSLMVDDRGDLAVVDGEANLIQAMNIKVWTRPGDLEVHPWFGFSGEVGQGVSIDLLARYQLELKLALLSDTRVDKINSLSLRTVGDTLTIRGDILAKGKDDAVGLTVFLPSGV